MYGHKKRPRINAAQLTTKDTLDIMLLWSVGSLLLHQAVYKRLEAIDLAERKRECRKQT
jgi:hypothetical protein